MFRPTFIILRVIRIPSVTANCFICSIRDVLVQQVSSKKFYIKNSPLKENSTTMQLWQWLQLLTSSVLTAPDSERPNLGCRVTFGSTNNCKTMTSPDLKDNNKRSSKLDLFVQIFWETFTNSPKDYQFFRRYLHEFLKSFLYSHNQCHSTCNNLLLYTQTYCWYISRSKLI